MSEASGKKEREIANAAHELFLLGQKTVEARAVLAALQNQLSEASNRLVDTQQVEHVIEANQQLVLAVLLAQSHAASEPCLKEQRLYEELREANAQLVMAALSAQDLQASAEQALIQQKSVLAMVAHELRNPLTPISLIAERMVRLPSDQLPRMRELIENQVRHISQLVEDLLDVSRASTGKLRIDRCDLDMILTLREAIEVCRPVISRKKQHLETHIPDGTLILNGDPVRLAQILNNLLANATKYTPIDGTITLSASIDSDVLEIRISDDGIGISPSVLPFIFNPYVQDEHAIGFNGTGLGIGLTVVRELVEAHGGKVTAASQGNGMGSEFLVTLPLSPLPETSPDKPEKQD
ncbi:sensor histidine kinase [Pseudomonas cannabina]|uniref:histidine kinase n=1 Tax=Pseudomonas cannabina TaxID=86840 RepID=A0A0P9KL00_PSECA|nr:HAMP domain-containing sensor histidine kinase [Pseudomonas cannabina]KAA8712047.1 HAMP domain-containing histidine kinase [Pseudomonas cannabina]KPW66137.1 putative histidine kinase in two-component regulatory system [Pseudomonas cannabina]SDQ49036.1 Signal transduction histidine kinase [Pseudomonas cannabina]